MSTTDDFVRGLKVAEELTGINKTTACRLADVDYSTLWRFMSREKDIKLSTLTALCEKGYQMSLSKIIALGEDTEMGTRNGRGIM